MAKGDAHLERDDCCGKPVTGELVKSELLMSKELVKSELLMSEELVKSKLLMSVS